MTDGILLAELQRDRQLRRYDTIIIDEAHERSLNIDFLLGYLKRLLPRRPGPQADHHLGDDRPGAVRRALRRRAGRRGLRPHLPGRGPLPAADRALDEDDEEGEAVVRDQTEAIVDAVKELSAEGPGDILVFLPGEREIRDTADALQADLPTGLEILPLYSRLSAAEQHRVFAPHRRTPGRARHQRRRDLADRARASGTSSTPASPGSRRYSARTKVQRLPIEPISQASANQRSGRCGRVAAGIAIRLYSEEDFDGRPEFTDPEILRTNLATVILQMTALGLGDIARFPFVEPPDQRNVSAGVQLLEELGALARPAGTTATG